MLINFQRCSSGGTLQPQNRLLFSFHAVLDNCHFVAYLFMYALIYLVKEKPNPL